MIPLRAIFIVCALFGTAQQKPESRTHDITVDDYFTLADVFAVSMSPDGKHVVYVEGRWQQSTDDRKNDLWVVNAETRQARRLTFDRANDRSPQWTPDSRTLYFAGNRKREGEKKPPFDGKTQVWRIDIGGGEPIAVTRVDGGIEQFQLAGDGNTLYYMISAESIDENWRTLRQRFRDIEYGHGINHFSQIWKLDLNTWRSEKLVDPARVIRDFAVSDDGKRIAMITTPDDKVVSFEGQSRVDVFDVDSRKTTTLPDRAFRADAPSPYGWLEYLAWSRDGQRLAFNVIFDGYPAEIMVADFQLAEPSMFKLPRPNGVSVKGYGSPLAWRGTANDLCFLVEKQGRVKLLAASDVRAGAEPRFKEIIAPEDIVVAGFSHDAAGDQCAVLLATPQRFSDIYLVNSAADPKRLTDVNPQTANWKLPKLQVVNWKGAHGDRVEGILELPPDYKEGQTLPLIVEIHGGPTTASHYHLQYWIYGRIMLPAHGYAVLCVNYRGSTGYGDKFLTDLVGKENDIDVTDILSGVDAMVERGIADPERLGVMGWSNGGYLTNCVISKTTRFKAASSGAGIVDAVMEFGSNDEPAYTIAFKRGFPWSNPEGYHRASPTYYLQNIRTPTLIHVGGNDERCPPGHSRMLYRALKEYVKVPTELLVYPGEAHGLMKYKNRKAKMEWDLAWFNKYVRGERPK